MEKEFSRAVNLTIYKRLPPLWLPGCDTLGEGNTTLSQSEWGSKGGKAFFPSFVFPEGFIGLSWYNACISGMLVGVFFGPQSVTFLQE